MQLSLAVLGCLASAAVAGGTGCARPATLGTGPACGPTLCAVSVQNDEPRRIAVRYDDSTGHGDLLGSVAPADVKSFPLPWVRSPVVTVTVTDYGRRYSDDVRVHPGWMVTLHYPNDFSDGSSGGRPR